MGFTVLISSVIQGQSDETDEKWGWKQLFSSVKLQLKGNIFFSVSLMTDLALI